ncbi:MAG: DUF1553 domain-containing protein [Kiritimatiellia bacterium]
MRKAGRTRVGGRGPGVAKIDYNRDVQPILSNYCYHCHGPDTASRAKKAVSQTGQTLRLDLPGHALSFVNSEGRRVIVPGKPGESELVSRIRSHDPDERMPKDGEKLLNPDQIRLLVEWIRQGAEFRNHWSFETPVKAGLPAVSQEAWCKGPVDLFVLARLDAAGLTPNPEADRRALIRRVTLDMTGLLPAPEEVEAFVADPAPTDAAYEKVVDRLQASPRYGEHRARHWLDYARYGDSHGIHYDGYRSIWGYRDYVINAFNANKPFDRFITEQLAGDLLPDGNMDSLAASGFVRAGISTGEGGTIVEENWNNLIRERTEAFGAVFLGMTTGCAVCHDHKYDPMTQRDMYSLAAYFGNLKEKPWTGDNHYWEPYQVICNPEDRPAFDAALGRRARAEADLRGLAEKEAPAMAAWVRTGPRPVREGLAAWFPLDEGAGAEIADRISGKKYPAEGSPPVWDDYPNLTGSFRTADNTRLACPDVGDFEKDQAFSFSGWVRLYEVVSPQMFGVSSGALVSRMDGTELRGWNIAVAANRLNIQLISQWPGNAINLLGDALPRPGWVHLAVTYDGSGKAAGVKAFLDGRPSSLKAEIDTLTGSIRTAAPFMFSRRAGTDTAAFPARQTGFEDVRLYRRVLTAEEVARLAYEDPLAVIAARKPDLLAPVDVRAAVKNGADPYAAAWTPFEKRVAAQAYFAAHPEAPAALRKEIAEAQGAMDALTGKVKVPGFGGGDKNGLYQTLLNSYEGKHGALTLVCRENETPAYAHILSRGEYTRFLARVYPDTPAFLPPQKPGAPPNRLGLAAWVVSPDNPLTARVAVNRIWQEIFGTGLVESAEDFGVVGLRPSHPELLDWLAVDFRESGWDARRLYKQLVLSAAYRQSAAVSREKLEKDPRNLLITRGPRYRMDAEEIRDCALQAAGLLNTEKVGGPSFKSYVPEGIFSSVVDTNCTGYENHHGPVLYRRSMYILNKRTVAQPDLEVFDGVDRLASCPRRGRTNTPLAALALMNDVTFLEAARALAEKTLREGGTDDTLRLQFMAARVLGRDLAAPEIAAFTRARETIVREVTPERAGKLLAAGEMKRDPAIDPVQHAVWMGLASLLMNTDAALCK